jgi:hypothetical protein
LDFSTKRAVKLVEEEQSRELQQGARSLAANCGERFNQASCSANERLVSSKKKVEERYCGQNRLLAGRKSFEKEILQTGG